MNYSNKVHILKMNLFGKQRFLSFLVFSQAIETAHPPNYWAAMQISIAYLTSLSLHLSYYDHYLTSIYTHTHQMGDFQFSCRNHPPN